MKTEYSRLWAGLLSTSICGAVLSFWSQVAGLAQPNAYFHQERHLFDAGTHGYFHYRVPGLVWTDQGTLIAWAEARKEEGDWGDIDIVLRRSLNRGRSWTKQRVLVDGDELLPEEVDHVAALGRTARSPTQGSTAHNMVMIPDGDRVHMIFCIEYSRCYYTYSDDEGATMRTPIEITAAFEGFRSEYDWKVIATGPGHGIRLRGGRLIVPVWISTADGWSPHHPSVVGTVYSDDRGRSWQAGDILVKDKEIYLIGSERIPQAYFDPNESVALELADGRVMINSRSLSVENRRIVTKGPDGATDWGVPMLDVALWDPVCHASMIRLSKKPENRRNRILFANPNSIDRPRDYSWVTQRRENLTVRLSYDEGDTWAVSKVIDSGFAGYSDMAVDERGMIYVLWEKGEEIQHLVLTMFSLEWLTDGRDRFENEKESVDP